MAFALCGKIQATPGTGDALQSHLLDAAAALEAAEQCRLYLVSRAAEEPDAVWVIEVWDDEDAHRASLQLEAVRQVIQRARPIIDAIPEAIRMKPVGGKGLAIERE